MNYFVLKVPAGPEDAVIDSLPEGAPAEWRFDEGQALAAEFPSDAVLKFSSNFPDGRRLHDFVANVLTMLIVSPKVRQVLEELEVPQVEYLPVTIVDHRGQVAGEDYSIVNLLGSQPAIDMSKSRYDMSHLAKDQIGDIDELVLDRDAIAADAKLFRATTSRRLFLMREDVLQALDAAGVEGKRTFVADGWDGMDF